MTAPDSRDSVEKIVAEMRNPPGRALTHLEYMAWILTWADRLQALARGPQQAGGEDYSALKTRLRDSAMLSTLPEWCRKELEQGADAIAALQAEVARLTEDCNAIREAHVETVIALREAGKDTERLDWMQPHVLAQWRGSAGSHTLLDHDGRAFLGSSLRGAIDQGMRDWRSDAALNGGQDDA